jgi:hypothetical protein
LPVSFINSNLLIHSGPLSVCELHTHLHDIPSRFRPCYCRKQACAALLPPQRVSAQSSLLHGQMQSGYSILHSHSWQLTCRFEPRQPGHAYSAYRCNVNRATANNPSSFATNLARSANPAQGWSIRCLSAIGEWSMPNGGFQKVGIASQELNPASPTQGLWRLG